MRGAPESLPGTGTDNGHAFVPKAVERFVFFSDAVFAFALTLLASGLKLPDGFLAENRQQLVHALWNMLPGFICYLVTFILVAGQWVRHHRLFEKLCDYDRRLIGLNFLLLLCVSLIPFVIDVWMSAWRVPLAIEIYAGVLAANGFASALVWWHTRRTPGLLSEAPTRGLLWREALEQSTLPVFALALLGTVAFSGAEHFGRNTALCALFVAVSKRLVRRISRRGPSGEDAVQPELPSP